MNLSLKGFSQLIRDMSATLQSSSTGLIDVSPGSVLRAVFESNASVALWLQWLILQVLQTTRASTSTGNDLDTWMGDFGVLRLPATSSTGTVTFSRYTPTNPVLVSVGSVVKTAEGSLSFSVTADPTLSIWQASSSSYLIPAGVMSSNLPVICNVSGSIGNVLAGTISVLASSIPGIDQVTNTSPLSNGIDLETDQALRNRFQNYLASRSRATLGAIQNAVAGIQQGLSVLVLENTKGGGIAELGTFLVLVDDGSGYPSAELLTNVYTAVDLVRPIGTTFSVMAPTVLLVNASLAISFNSSNILSSEIDNIKSTIAQYLNSLPIGSNASITRIVQQVYIAGNDIINIESVQLNGGNVDVVPPALTVIKAGQVVVTSNVR